MILIRSPVSGKTQRWDQATLPESISSQMKMTGRVVYLSRDTPHEFVSPFDAQVLNVIVEDLKTPLKRKFEMVSTVFTRSQHWREDLVVDDMRRMGGESGGAGIVMVGEEDKLRRVWIVLKHDAMPYPIVVMLEVGRPIYSTDEIRLDVKRGQRVKQNEVMGEMIFDDRPIEVIVKEGERVQGGQRMGRMIHGSTAEIFIPHHPSFDWHWQPLKWIKAGQTVIAEYNGTQDSSPPN